MLRESCVRCSNFEIRVGDISYACCKRGYWTLPHTEGAPEFRRLITKWASECLEIRYIPEP